MADKTPAKPGKTSKGFNDAERDAIKERARELKAEARAGKDRAAGERAVAAKVGEMPPADRALGQRIHAIVTSSAPGLIPKLWYGMPAYANNDGKVVCFFQAASKFKTRYASFAFMDAAKLDADSGGMWPTGFGLKSLTPADEARLASLVKKAVR